MLTGTRARRLLIEDGRCVGVEPTAAAVRAQHEVVVCAGAIDSPKLLMLSGIGKADALTRLGIEVVADLPGVGENLQDHMLTPLIYSSARPVPPVAPGTQGMHAHLFDRSKPGLAVPDTQPLVLPHSRVRALDGRAGGRLHADGRACTPGEPRDG